MIWTQAYSSTCIVTSRMGFTEGPPVAWTILALFTVGPYAVGYSIYIVGQENACCHTALPTIDQPFLIHYKVLFQCHCTKLTYILLFWYEVAPEWLRIYHTVTMATNIPFTLGHLHIPSIHKDLYVLWIHKSNYIFTTIDTQLWINCLILSLHRKAYYLCKHKHDIVRFPYFHSCIIYN